jgi:hypothetical protein
MWRMISQPGPIRYALAQAALLLQMTVLAVSVAHDSTLEPTQAATVESGHTPACANAHATDGCLLCTSPAELGLTGNTVGDGTPSAHATGRTGKQRQTAHTAARRVQSARAPPSS